MIMNSVARSTMRRRCVDFQDAQNTGNLHPVEKLCTHFVAMITDKPLEGIGLGLGKDTTKVVYIALGCGS